MVPPWPRAWGSLPGSAVIRYCPEDFQVSEQLGFELSGEGEHRFLYLQKRQLNSMELLQRLSDLSGVAQRDIGISGLKDRNAVTRQWFSVGMAGRPEPDWYSLQTGGDVLVLEVGHHLRKLRRGVHRANRFTLVLRELQGERAALAQRLQKLRDAGVPNYFGEQRFGRNGSTREQARAGRGDIHPGLPLWGRVPSSAGTLRSDLQADCLVECEDIGNFLEESGLDLAWRPARMLPDDFCWQFCDDGTVQLDFSLGAGSYATALLAEFVQYK